MQERLRSDDKSEIAETMRQTGEAWLNGKPAELEALFHEGITTLDISEEPVLG